MDPFREAEERLSKLLEYCREKEYLSEGEIESTREYQMNRMEMLRRLEVRDFEGFSRAFDAVMGMREEIELTMKSIGELYDEGLEDLALDKMVEEYEEALLRILFVKAREG